MPPDPDLDRIESILERWFELQHEGVEPTLDELCADAPHLRDRIGEMLERQAALLDGRREESVRRPLEVDRVGEFELKARLGSGGMGDVYLARQPSLDRLVALKILRPELADDPLRRLRFQREAQLTAALDHPHIVPIYEAGEDRGIVYLVMKRLHGVTLERVESEWTAQRVARVGAAVARALHAAHEVGIVHRDVKPANVLLDGDHPYVLDFGLARGRVDMTLTTEGQLPGTLAYMPPEALRGDPAALDPRADVYSLAATLFHCMEGRPPFDADTPESMVRHVLVDDPPALSGPSRARDLQTVLHRGLDKTPTRRFPTALEFAEDLERFAEGIPIRSRRPSVWARVRTAARRHPLVATAFASTLVVGSILGSQIWRQERDRAAELDRQFEVIDAALGTGDAPFARARLVELEANEGASEDPRFEDRSWRCTSILARDALLDQIQTDPLYQQVALTESVRATLDAAHPSLRTDAQTGIALALMAFYSEDFGQVRRLLTDSRLESMPRFVAALRAELDGASVVDALAAVESEMATTATDHVFSAVVLRVAEAPVDAIAVETESALKLDPFDRRARLMQAMVFSLQGDEARAEQALLALWREDEPRPELHARLAKVAVLNRHYDIAERHVEIAARDLRELGRGPTLRLATARLNLALRRRELDRASAVLAEARRHFDGEWLDMGEGYLALLSRDRDAARAAFERVVSNARTPWNRRRAKTALLHLDVNAYLAGDELDLDVAEVLFARADEQYREAVSASDDHHAAQSAMRAAEIELTMIDIGESSQDWRGRAWKSLHRVLASQDLNPDAIAHFAGLVAERAVPASGRHDLVTGDLTYQARRRALAVTRRIRDGKSANGREIEITILAAVLSAAVGDVAAAREAAEVATSLLDRLDAASREDEFVADLEELLDEAMAGIRK